MFLGLVSDPLLDVLIEPTRMFALLVLMFALLVLILALPELVL